MVEPTPKQIEIAELMGFEYIGDGWFVKGEFFGWFTEKGFHKELEKEFEKFF